MEEEKKVAPAPEEEAEGCCCGGKECCCGKEEKGSACECEEGKEGCSRRKRALILTSAIASLVMAICLLIIAFEDYFMSYGTNDLLAVGMTTATLNLLGAAAFACFGIFSLLHLVNGKFHPRALFAVTGIAIGGIHLLTSFAYLADQGNLHFTASGIAEMVIYMLLAAGVVTLGILALAMPHKCEKCGRLMSIISYSVTTAYLLFYLISLASGSSLLSLPISSALVYLIAGIVVEVIGLIVVIDASHKNVKEEKRLAEALLAYKELEEKGVLSEDEFEEKKKDLLG